VVEVQRILILYFAIVVCLTKFDQVNQWLNMFMVNKRTNIKNIKHKSPFTLNTLRLNIIELSFNFKEGESFELDWKRWYKNKEISVKSRGSIREAFQLFTLMQEAYFSP